MSDVLVHRRWGTVHQLRADGNTWCGNGRSMYGNSDAYDLMSEEEARALPRHRDCERCVWITQEAYFRPRRKVPRTLVAVGR